MRFEHIEGHWKTEMHEIFLKQDHWGIKKHKDEFLWILSEIQIYSNQPSRPQHKNKNKQPSKNKSYT